MNGSSLSVTLIFTAYKEIDSAKNVFFTIVLLIYIASVLTNVTLMLLIYSESTLHKPMYIFLFSLVAHGLIGSTAIWPKVMSSLLTGLNTVSYVGCLVQVFFAATYGACNYTVLTVMAYDRLVSIFQPLQYHAIMTPYKVKQLLLAADLVPVLCVIGQICLTSRMLLCKNTIHRIHCDNLSVTALSCSDRTQSRAADLYGMCLVIVFLILPLLLVLLSYVKIILFVLMASGKARQKTFETCSPHIIVFVNFSVASLFAVVYNRINPYLPVEANVFLSVNYILVPPLLHPIIYGIKNQEIRKSLSNLRKKICLDNLNIISTI